MVDEAAMRVVHLGDQQFMVFTRDHRPTVRGLMIQISEDISILDMR